MPPSPIDERSVPDFDGKLRPILEPVFLRLFDAENQYQLLIALLNDLLELPEGERIGRVESLRTRILGQQVGEKEPVVDLLVKDQLERQIQIEIQLCSQPAYMHRAVYYLARVHGAQLDRGQEYHRVGRTICIHILDWGLFLPEEQWRQAVTRVKLCDEQSGRVVSEQLQLMFVELKKFQLDLEVLHTRLEKWLYYLKYGARLSLEQVGRMNMRELQQVDEKLRVISRERELRLQAIYEEMRERDAVNLRMGSLREGFEQGVKEGLQAGRQEGIQAGRQEGQRLLILQLLQAKFGPLADERRRKLEQIEDDAILAQLATQVLTAPSLEALGL